jgi:hypothetical protein
VSKPSAYLLQLAKHFRHKLDVRFDAHTAVHLQRFGRRDELRVAWQRDES